ncbi:cytochrome-c oxidase, cbb3-type subunit III [Oricola cellulosilytica]|uniref:Cbb3-type cytochrome c oxidase subunit n=1 Tax=Oricola cellulosilytica TaxID=1429082 RepID=A0A4R0PE94_9HYPH|nr:cytochrome-c oxidase, cbb3-type subunit III [Oricola cellulosilytica]TCD14938.1 cytochrome-c oxidase, cbb3-type subunit III [Oricola cellulosilytica]
MADNDKKEIDELSGVETTGHEWDGIRELNNPLPRWWLWTFYATIVWSIGYTIAYPAWPLIDNATAGVLGWSSRADLADEVSQAAMLNQDKISAIQSAAVSEIAADENLRQFATAGGASAFKVYCVQCHGSGAAGSAGYPNLNDDDWIWGGTVDDIYSTLMHGIRYDADADTRFNDMPAYGGDEILTRAEISDVAWYVRKLSDQDFDETAAANGEAIYADNCAACHGDTGEGVAELGGPNLSDAIWLYGGTHAQIAAQISNPRMGMMPGWGERLGEAAVKQLAVYVHGLGGGE